MVNSGHFALRVIDASTGATLHEYMDATGQVWVCGEEGKEFFIQVQHVSSPGVDTSCYLSVDGENVGYMPRSYSDMLGTPTFYGTIGLGQDYEQNSLKLKRAGAHNQNVPVMRAFKFVRVDHVRRGVDERPPRSFGHIEAVWHRSTPSGRVCAPNPYPWQGTSSTASAKNKEGAAVLKAAVGSTSTSFNLSDEEWTVHEEIGRANIRYTSEFGLAFAGIWLPQDAVANAQPSSPDS